MFQFCHNMDMKLSPSKTLILSGKSNGLPWIVDDQPLEEVLVAKYLGVKIQVKGRSLAGQHEQVMVTRAQAYAQTILGLSKAGLD